MVMRLHGQMNATVTSSWRALVILARPPDRALHHAVAAWAQAGPAL